MDRTPDYDLTCSQAARLCPGRPHPSAVWRWCRQGLEARNGERVYLDHIRVGRKLLTSAPAITAFLSRLNDADAEHFRPEPVAHHADAEAVAETI